MGCVNANESIKDINEYVNDYGWCAENVYGEAGVLRIGSSKNAGILETPLVEVEGKVTVEFNAWLYNSKDSGVKLTATIYDASYLDVASVDIVPTTAKNAYKLSADVEYGCWVKFSTEGSTGQKRVNIDDIAVKIAGSTSSVKVAEVSVEGTSYKFEDLESGCIYRYRVRANDATGSSGFSAYSDVTLLPTSINDIDADNGNVELFTVTGVKVYEGDRAAVPSLVPGVYIVKSGNRTAKMLVE